MTPLERARSLLALATGAGATPEEQRTAAHALARLIVKHGLRLVGSASQPSPSSPGAAPSPKPAAPAPSAGFETVLAADREPDGWALYYVKLGTLPCKTCGTPLVSGSLAWRRPNGEYHCPHCARLRRLADNFNASHAASGVSVGSVDFEAMRWR